MNITRIALAVAFCGAGFAAADETPSADAKLLAKLHETNALEVELGKLAQQKGGTPEVKQFGKQLVEDHQSVDTKILALAGEESIELEAAPKDPADAKKSTEMKAKLKTLSGETFDQEFLTAMRQGHEEAIALVTKAKPSLQNTKVKSLVTELEPVLEKHRQMAQSGGHDHTKADKARTKTDSKDLDPEVKDIKEDPSPDRKR
jgi:putative membrane protein